MEPKESKKGTKMEPKWHTEATRPRNSAPGTSKSVPRPLRDRFWIIFGSKFDGFLMDFRPLGLCRAGFGTSWVQVLGQRVWQTHLQANGSKGSPNHAPDLREDQLGAGSLQISRQTHWTETPPALPPTYATLCSGHRAGMAKPFGSARCPCGTQSACVASCIEP